MATFRPFEASDLVDAGRLLAERHGAHRTAQPLLPKRYEDPEVSRAEIAELWQGEAASGAVAVDDGRLTGFLIGAPRSEQVWGSNLWFELASHAVLEAEQIRDLYALVAADWVARGHTAHYAVVPADDPALVDAWFRLGFGQQQVHAIRDLAAGPPTVPDGLTLRAPGRSDLDVLAELDLALPAHQGQTPVFSAGTVPSFDESRADWEKDLDDPSYTTFVAERDGRVIGSAVGCSLEKSRAHRGLARPDNAGYLAFAAVLPDARGTGAGRALGEAVIHWAAQTGYASIVTDWRATNLLSSRTWPRLGFTPTFLRLHRLTGH